MVLSVFGHDTEGELHIVEEHSHDHLGCSRAAGEFMEWFFTPFDESEEERLLWDSTNEQDLPDLSDGMWDVTYDDDDNLITTFHIKFVSMFLEPISAGRYRCEVNQSEVQLYDFFSYETNCHNDVQNQLRCEATISDEDFLDDVTFSWYLDGEQISQPTQRSKNPHVANQHIVTLREILPVDESEEGFNDYRYQCRISHPDGGDIFNEPPLRCGVLPEEPDSSSHLAFSGVVLVLALLFSILVHPR